MFNVGEMVSLLKTLIALAGNVQLQTHTWWPTTIHHSSSRVQTLPSYLHKHWHADVQIHTLRQNIDSQK